MRRILGVLVLVATLLSLLVGREWLIHREIESLQISSRSQMNDVLESSATLNDLQSLQNASRAYHRYIEPIVNTSSRLLWPNAREDLVSAWSREVFSQLEVAQNNKAQALKTEASEKQKAIKEGKEASSQRLIELVTVAETQDPDFVCSQLVKSELDEIQTNGQKKDSETLAQIQQVQKTALSRLRTRIRGMNDMQLGRFLSSNAYRNEILSPVQRQILQLRQEKLRRESLQSFDSEVVRVLSGHRGHMQKTRELRSEQETRSERISKLLEPLTRDPEALDKMTAEDWKALAN